MDLALRLLVVVSAALAVFSGARYAVSITNPLERQNPARARYRLEFLQSTLSWLKGATVSGPSSTDLCYAIELLNLCSMSGMSIVQSFEAVGQSGTSKVHCAFAQAAVDFKAGFTKNEILQRLHERLGGGAVYSLTSSLRRAEENGTPLSQVLHAQAQNAKKLEYADRMKALELVPLWIVVVTVTLLLPTIICVSMVPHLLAFMESAW